MAEKNTEKQRAAEQQLAEIAKISDEELFKRLDTDEEGLNQVEASERLEEYGKNIIDTGNENSLAKRVREALINPFNVVLLIVAAVTLVTDVIIAEKPSWATFLMLIFVVAVSGIISFVQAEKSNHDRHKQPPAGGCSIDSNLFCIGCKGSLMCRRRLSIWFIGCIIAE